MGGGSVSLGGTTVEGMTPSPVLDALVLDRPEMTDVDAIFEIYSDPRVWTHFPQARFTEREQAEEVVRRAISDWESEGLGPWIVREVDGGPVVGSCGCSLRSAIPAVSADDDCAYWNLGYRFRPEVQGRGYATEVSRTAIAAAQDHRPHAPILASLLEHNLASSAVAKKTGLSLQHRGPDAGNPDPEAIRLIFADRELTSAQMQIVLA